MLATKMLRTLLYESFINLFAKVSSNILVKVSVLSKYFCLCLNCEVCIYPLTSYVNFCGIRSSFFFPCIITLKNRPLFFFVSFKKLNLPILRQKIFSLKVESYFDHSRRALQGISSGRSLLNFLQVPPWARVSQKCEASLATDFGNICPKTQMFAETFDSRGAIAMYNWILRK